jgi:hypothetical protein
VRHGLTAETAIGLLEDAEDYRAFEAAILGDYDAQSAVERVLVLRLASVLWRLHRATTMETGLFQIQAEHRCEFSGPPSAPGGAKSRPRNIRVPIPAEGARRSGMKPPTHSEMISPTVPR